jgi:hypothetical protein
MEAKKLIQHKNLACNLCEGYAILIVEQDKKESKIEKCMKCYGTGIGNL